MFCPRCVTDYPADFVVCPKDRTALLKSRRIGKYEIDGVVGEGGMGAVYRAVNPDIDARVAVKVMRTEMATSEQARLRFQREAKAVGALKTTHIVQVFDFGVEPDGTMFLVMELLEGHTLRQEITLPPSPMHLARVQMVFDGALKGLAAAHRAGIVHRDLKPDNLFIASMDDVETPKLLDFGIARVESKDARENVQPLTQTGAMMGTASYMAPEQMSSRPGGIGAWTDVFAMGAILYEMLTGSPAFGGNTLTEVLMRVSETTYTPLATARPGLPAKVYELVERCLSHDPTQRPQDAERLRAALLDAQLVEPGAKVPAPRLRGEEFTQGLDATAHSDGPVLPPVRPVAPPAAPTMHAAMTRIVEDDAAVRRLLAYFTPRAVPASTELFRLGDDSTTLYLVESGELAAELPAGTGSRSLRVAAGSVIGEAGLYRKAKRSATVRTATACTLLELSADALANMQRDAPELLTRFHQFVTATLADRMASEQAAAPPPPPRSRPMWQFAVAGVAAIGLVGFLVTRHDGAPAAAPPPPPPSPVDAAAPRADASAVTVAPVDAAVAADAHPGMIRIEGGTFQIGQAGANWLPPATVTLPAYWIDRNELTRAELETALGDKLPAATRAKIKTDAATTSARYVTWGDASAACVARGKRLPTEAEWEVAARKTPNDPARARLLRKDGDADLIAPATDCSDTSACDMLGGVSEWTADDVKGHPGAKAVRGASYRDKPGSKLDTIHQRQIVNVSESDNTIGFRCALSLEGPP